MWLLHLAIVSNVICREFYIRSTLLEHASGNQGYEKLSGDRFVCQEGITPAEGTRPWEHQQIRRSVHRPTGCLHSHSVLHTRQSRGQCHFESTSPPLWLYADTDCSSLQDVLALNTDSFLNDPMIRLSFVNDLVKVSIYKHETSSAGMISLISIRFKPEIICSKPV